MCQTISPLIVARNLPVKFGIEFAPTTVSITGSQPSSTRRQTVKLSGRVKQWSSTSEPFATTDRTTGSNCYRWRNLHTTTLSSIPRWWHPSGRTTSTTLRCSSSLPRTPVSYHRCRQTRGWQAWKRLTKFSGKTYLRLMSTKHSAMAGRRWLLPLETNYGYGPRTWEHIEFQRNSITNTPDCIRQARLSIRILTIQTCREQCGPTTFSMCCFSIVIHRQSDVNHYQ